MSLATGPMMNSQSPSSQIGRCNAKWGRERPCIDAGRETGIYGRFRDQRPDSRSVLCLCFGLMGQRVRNGIAPRMPQRPIWPATISTVEITGARGSSPHALAMSGRRGARVSAVARCGEGVGAGPCADGSPALRWGTARCPGRRCAAAACDVVCGAVVAVRRAGCAALLRGAGGGGGGSLITLAVIRHRASDPADRQAGRRPAGDLLRPRPARPEPRFRASAG